MSVPWTDASEALTEQAKSDGIPNAAERGPYCNEFSEAMYICTLPPSHKGDHVAHVSKGEEPIAIVDRWPQ